VFSSQDSLPRNEYEYVIDKFLESCNGFPLSLKVLGAHLYGKEISEWQDELGSLSSEVKERLKISYALDTEEQWIFLDIACKQGYDHKHMGRIRLERKGGFKIYRRDVLWKWIVRM
jgi:hypothetical protein